MNQPNAGKNFMLKHSSISCQLVGFGIGSLKTDDDATNRANAAAGVRPSTIVTGRLRAVSGVLASQRNTAFPASKKPEPSLDDRSLRTLEDEKAARFAIACFLWLSNDRNFLVASLHL